MNAVKFHIMSGWMGLWNGRFFKSHLNSTPEPESFNLSRGHGILADLDSERRISSAAMESADGEHEAYG